jgi:hypothetical protein
MAELVEQALVMGRETVPMPEEAQPATASPPRRPALPFSPGASSSAAKGDGRAADLGGKRGTNAAVPFAPASGSKQAALEVSAPRDLDARAITPLPAELAAELGDEQGPLRTTGELPRDLVAQLAKAALPFAARREAAPSSAEEAEATTDELPRDFLTRPAQAALPFGPMSPAALAAPLAGGGASTDAKPGATTGELPRDLVEWLRKAPLPFEAARREEGEAPMSAAPVTAPVPPTAPAGDPLPFRPAPPAAPALGFDEYASLCAELAVFPDQAEAAFARYGLANAQVRRDVDLAWQERLRQNPAEFTAWQTLYQRALAQARSDAGRRSGR